MPDPHQVLAPLIEPVAPPALPSRPDVPLPAILAVAGLILVLALALWLWRRGTPRRQLRRLARQPDPLQAAGQLAAWVRAQGMQPAPEWRADLERLRFAPPAADAAATLTRLCREIDRHHASPDVNPRKRK